MGQFDDLTKRHSLIAELELGVEAETSQIPNSKKECGMLCVDLARRIEEYSNAVGKLYNDDPEQMSTFILCLLRPMGPYGQVCESGISAAQRV